MPTCWPLRKIRYRTTPTLSVAAVHLIVYAPGVESLFQLGGPVGLGGVPSVVNATSGSENAPLFWAVS